ncbi:hypothetical protein AC622_01435 [Bacillus sp. FJAT-27916]|nr:hypothetical protein AC622_01435 [Bacillus sp. FJAT-27916]
MIYTQFPERSLIKLFLYIFGSYQICGFRYIGHFRLEMKSRNKGFDAAVSTIERMIVSGCFNRQKGLSASVKNIYK